MSPPAAADGPLLGRVILVTRPADLAEGLADRLRRAGAEPLVASAIAVEPVARTDELDRAVADAASGAYDVVAFTSAAGVRAWADRAEAIGVGPPDARIAVVGDATGESVRRLLGGEPDLTPAAFTTAALGEAFPPGPGEALLARADRASEELGGVLREKGWRVTEVDAYRVVPATALPPKAIAALDAGRIDAITFTSPSTVEGFARLAGVPAGVSVAAIGPVTADAARRAGFDIAAIAEPHTEDGLVVALERLFV